MARFPEAADAWFWYSLLAPVLALAANVVAQVLLVRLRKGAHFLRSVVEGCLAGAGLLVVLEGTRLFFQGISLETLALTLLVNAPAYLALSYCYFNFVNLGQSSVRIRIYARIAEAPAGLLMEEIAREYNESALLQLRLHRLNESGDMVEKNGVFHTNRRRLVWIAAVIFKIKQFLLGKTGEFK